MYTISGIAIIWNHNKMDLILKGEFSVMIPIAMLEMAGEIVTNWKAPGPGLRNPHIWHHVLLDIAAIMLGGLCLLFYKLKVQIVFYVDDFRLYFSLKNDCKLIGNLLPFHL